MQTNYSILRKLAQGRQKYGARLFLKRRIRRIIDSLFFRVDKTMLLDSLRSVGLKQGMTIMVHSSVSRLGFVVGGAKTIVDALLESVGAQGCVMMPAFSMRGSMKEFLEQMEIFDCRKTIANTGLLTETFRAHDGVLRSTHPTHSVLAAGFHAKDLLEDHWKSLTPYGPKTPFGRIAERDDTFILLIDTHLHSLLHHLQERVDFPNLYLEKDMRVNFINDEGQANTMVTKVMRPMVPYYVAVPSVSDRDPSWAELRDFALNFPSRRDSELKRLGYSFDGYPRLYDRRRLFTESGIFSMTKLGRAEVGLLHIKPFLEIIEPELRTLLEHYKKYYDPQKIIDLHLPPPY